MPTPATRTPVRIARGTYSNLNSSIADLQEGEVCYATDQNKVYVVESATLVESPSPDLTGDITSVGNATSIASGVIVNADVNASAAIAGTKISPDFGSQTIATTGVFSHALGAVGTPSITFTGDTNTGIYSPGADQVAVATNGTGRLFIDASGRTGVGPINNSSTFAASTSRASTTYGFVVDTYNGASFENSLYFGFNGSVQNIGNFQNFPLALLTNNTERLRITAAGLVGIGTSSPNSVLDVNVTSNDSSIFEVARFAANNSGATSLRVLAGQSNTNTTLRRVAIDAFRADSNIAPIDFTQTTSGGTLTRMRIDAAGRVGIGTTSPGSTLTVNGTARVQNAATFAGINIQNSNDSFVATTTSFIDASNNLGTIDSHLFFEHLTTGGSNAIIATTPTGDRAVDRRVTRLIINSAGTTTLNSATSTAPFIAQINGAEAARIDSSGRLLVGTSSARSTWFAATLTPQIQIEGASANTSSLSLLRTDANSSGARIALGQLNGGSVSLENYTAGEITFQANDGTNLLRAAGISAAVDGTPGANDMPGRLVFSTTADGASSPTERMRINSAGEVTITGKAQVAALGIGQAAGTGTELDLSGRYAQTSIAVAALDIDCSLGNYFTKTVDGSVTFTVSNIPASRTYTFAIHIYHTSGTITWFSGVRWPRNTAPTLTTARQHTFIFTTHDGGANWFGAALVDYTT